MIRTSEIPGKTGKDKRNFMVALIIGMKSALNETHVVSEEKNFKKMIENGRDALQEINQLDESENQKN
jgi:hypothetical protein